DAAAAGARVAGDGAVVDCDRAEVGDAAAEAAGGVVGNGGIDQSQVSAALNVDATAVDGGFVGVDGAAKYRRGAEGKDCPAADAGSGIACERAVHHRQ